MTAAMRCRCAHEALDACERDPNAANAKILSQIDESLLEAQMITGRADAQGCGLGSDDEIWARLANAACAKAWEGTISLERVITTDTSLVKLSPLGDVTSTEKGGVRQRFQGRLTELTSEDAYTRDDGSSLHDWTLQTSGFLTAGKQRHRVEIFEDGRRRSVRDYTTQGGGEWVANSDSLNLRFENGLFASLGVGAPKKKATYPMREVQTHATTCKDNDPKCPPTTTTVSLGEQSPYQAYYIHRNDKELVSFSDSNRHLRLTWRRRLEFPASGDTVGG